MRSEPVAVPVEAFGQETDNEAKYGEAGGIEQRVIGRFRRRLLAQLVPLAPSRVLDAGCGEGHVSEWIQAALPDAAIVGIDGRGEAVAAYRVRNPRATGHVGDLASLDVEDGAFDAVVCTEVLEHLPDPPGVVRELARVVSGHVLVTVPHEPLFRGVNLARGRYVGRFGSTPGHLSTWGRRGLTQVLSPDLEVVRWWSAFPWQGVVARPRDPAR